MQNRKVLIKGTNAEKLMNIGLAVILLQFSLVFVDVAFGLSGEGANIGLGILSFYTLPLGTLMILGGLLLAIFQKPNKS